MSLLIVIGIGAGLLFLFQFILIRTLWSRRLSVDIHFQSEEAVAGGQSALTEVITNRKWFPIPVLHIKFQINRNLHFRSMSNAQTSDLIYKNDMFSLLFYQKITRTLPFTCERRGYYTIRHADAVAYSLFFSGRLVKSIPQDTELYVFPEPVDEEALDIPFRRMMGELVTKRFLYQDPFEFSGIRDYTIQDPLKTVNWKATARTGELKTNTYEYTAGQEVCLVLNLEDEAVLRNEQLLESSISLAAALASRFLLAGIPVSLFTNGPDIESREPVSMIGASGGTQVNQMKRKLARIDLTESVPHFSTVYHAVDEHAKTMQDACMLVISTSRQKETVADIEALSVRYPGLFWILPLFTDDDDIPGDTDNMTTMKWEVARRYV